MFDKKNNKYIYKFKTKYLSIVLLSGWIEYKFEDKDEKYTPLTFIKENNGVGALQISIATTKEDKLFDINKYLRMNNEIPTSNIKEYKLNDWTIYEYKIIQNDRYVEYFQLSKLNIIVTATYNCELKYFNKSELNEAKIIINTIEIINKD